MLDDRGKLNSVETANPSTPSFVPSEEYNKTESVVLSSVGKREISLILLQGHLG